MRRRLPARRFARRQHDWLWKANSIAIGNGSAFDDAILLAPADWQVAATVSFERATLVAIRGWLSFSQITVEAGSFPALYLTVLKLAVSEATPNPSLIAGYDDHDILWTYGMAMTGSNEQVATPSGLQLDPGCNTIQVDIKVKRKLDSSENIVLAVAAASGTTPPGFTCVGILRCLVDRQ